jgi:hypothetical protein
MLPTWVLGFPSGHESGEYLTIDLGGTKLRICWVTLNQGKGENHSESEIYHIPKDYKVGTADQLWSFLADSLEDFMTKRHIEPEEDTVIPLGFTFSYPATQEYIDQGVLQTWTKGFDIKGVEGHDVADQLRQALHRKVRPLRCLLIHIGLTLAGTTSPDRRTHQRHSRCHDRIRIQRSRNHHRRNIRPRMQRFIHGELRLHRKTRRSARELAYGDKLRIWRL